MDLQLFVFELPTLKKFESILLKTGFVKKILVVPKFLFGFSRQNP